MSFSIPPNGVYRIQNEAYPEQMIGLEFRVGGLGLFVAGRHEDSSNPHIEWQVKAVQEGEYGMITMKSDSRDASDFYIGFDSRTVGYSSTPYEWELSFRGEDKWAIMDRASGLLLFLPSNVDRTPVGVTMDGGDASYWRFIPKY
ncbi:hypothetical protein BDR04DRAFT_1086396 [Suillus decipiens]|nr:hypothetical protein BDR04DRAFT_1086396 [Suillus decipiens]